MCIYASSHLQQRPVCGHDTDAGQVLGQHRARQQARRFVTGLLNRLRLILVARVNCTGGEEKLAM